MRKRFALREGEPRRLEVAFGFRYSDVTISLDDQPVAGPFSRTEIEVGRNVTLPDGSTLSIGLEKSHFLTDLHLYRNGEPLPGSSTDPQRRITGAWGAALFIAVVNVILGIVTVVSANGDVEAAGNGLGLVIFGVAFAILAFFIRRRSRVALGIALVVFIGDAVATFVMAIGSGERTGGHVMRILLVILMFRGFEAIKEIREREAMPLQVG